MIPVLRVKPGVTFERIAPGGFRILSALDDACQILHHDLTITSGTNDHETGRHPLGEAYDISTAGLMTWEIRKLVDVLRRRLGPAFGVFYETPVTEHDPILIPVALKNSQATAPHIHLQVAKGTQYPPVDVAVTHV